MKEASDEPPLPSLPPLHQFQEFQKMISKYLQTSMANGHKLRPTVWPTEKEFSDAEEKFKYDLGDLHFVVTGIAGIGKRSLVNSFRGLLGCDGGAAEIRANETAFAVPPP